MLPVTTRSRTSGEDNYGNNTGLIVGVVIEFLIILFLVAVVGWFYYQKRKNTFKENGQRTILPHDVRAGAQNSAYMDLQERGKTDKQNERLPEIREQNVNIVSTFPGRGLIVYQKAIVTRNSRNQDVVVKSLSEQATIKFEKLWSAEITSVLNLKKHCNVVEMLGWCYSAPNFLVTELINGGNLLKHLTENFSPHKLHQYGNTKEKRFHVQERGNPENLPRYALDVSRGLRFLLDNKFIHPGLRAQKVLVDLAGRCKLYDFISAERAKDGTSVLWSESVPYQWMSPEYLLLGTLSDAGDVWSFGVLLWEIFTYGSQPYPGEDRKAVENSLRNTDRLLMPQNCPGAIWQLMIGCWEQSAEPRPRLEEITSKLSTMCSDDKEYEEVPNRTPVV